MLISMKKAKRSAYHSREAWHHYRGAGVELDGLAGSNGQRGNRARHADKQRQMADKRRWKSSFAIKIEPRISRCGPVERPAGYTKQIDDNSIW